MFGIGETELVLILLFSFLVFGPDKWPGMGRTLGRALRQFRSAQEGFNKVVQSDLLDPAADVLNEKPKRSEKLRSAASDDSDIDGEAPKQETFAERRARLKAEREAAQKTVSKRILKSRQVSLPLQTKTLMAVMPNPKQIRLMRKPELLQRLQLPIPMKRKRQTPHVICIIWETGVLLARKKRLRKRMQKRLKMQPLPLPRRPFPTSPLPLS